MENIAMELHHHHHCQERRNKTTSMTTMLSITMNEDVILEILVRLPLISVLRFKLVSKTWYALISLPNFLVRHSFYYHRYIQETRRNDRLSDGLCFGPKLAMGRFSSCRYRPFEHQPDYLIFLPPPSNDDQIQNPPPPPPPPPPILHTLKEDEHPLAFFPIARPMNNNDNDDHPMAKFSFFSMSSFCNGLVIFRGHDSSENIDDISDGHSYDSSYFLCNPILKQYIELPRINPLLLHENDHLEPLHEYEPAILFDPAISLSYKVIRFLERGYTDDSKYFLQMFVYSQPPPSSSAKITTTGSSSSWRLVASFHFNSSLYSNNGVFLNGVSYSLCQSEDFIICFDVVKEIVWFLQLPSIPMETCRTCRYLEECGGHTYRYLGECGGHLQLVAEHSPDYPISLTFPCNFDVFEMEHHQQQHDHDQEVIHPAVWTLKYRVNNIQPPPSYHHILKDCDIHVMRLYKTGRKGEDGKEEEALLMKMFRYDDEKDMMLIFDFNLASNTFGELLNIPFGHYADNYEDVFPYTMTLFPLSPQSSSFS